MIVCKKCTLYHGKDEFRVSNDFIEGEKYPAMVNGEKIKWPGCDVEMSWGPVPMCNHKSCFKTEEKNDLVNGKTKKKVRIKGQAQLNKDFNCQYFKNAFWRFWIRGDNE